MTTTRKVNAHPSLGTLQAGDVVLGERTSGTTGLLTVPTLGGITDGDKGDITVSGSGATWTIDNSTVTLAKQANMATASVVYRKTAGSGAPEVNTLATLKTDLGLTGTNSGDQTSIVGITGTMAQFDTAVTDGNIVYQSQALGTPASGSLTNCTGLPVAGGGTGIATTTAYSVICAGTTATGNFQSLAALGATGSRLTSAGAGALPSFKGGLTSFRAYLSGLQAISSAVDTKCALATEDFDVGGYFDNATNYRYTPLIAGKYFFYGVQKFDTSIGVGTLVLTYIFKNGSAVPSTFQYSPTGGYLSNSVGTIMDMNGSTDYVEFYVNQNSGLSKNLLSGTTGTFFSGVLMEAT
jgi:hypothetical protein